MNFQRTKSVMLQAVLLLTAIISTHLLQSQAWFENLPQSKVQNRTLTLKDYQKAFNEYWEPYQVENGYYVQNGERVKAPYWKQFKRWEWYWETRVNPKKGTFPTTSAADEYQKYLLENHGGLRSPSGNWTSVGPSSSGGGYAGIGRLNCVAFRPGDNNTIYAGAASGGIWKTTNGGNTWIPLGDQNTVLAVSDIIVISGTPDILYIATGDKDGGSLWSLGGDQSNDNNSVGVLKSTDGGVTWNPTGLTFTASQKRTISRLILDPNSGNQTIYAATSVGIYKTTNGGTTWPLQFASTEHFIDMEMNPSNSTILYASTIDYWGTPKIYYTTNGGTNWTASTTPFVSTDKRIDLAVTAANPAYVYAVVANQNGGLSTVNRSTNTGVNFSTVYSGSATTNLLGWYADESGGTTGQGGYDLCIIVSPINANEVYVGGVNTHKSTDGGSNWSCVSCWTWGSTYNNTNPQAPVVHADQHFLAYQNGTSTLFLCNDGGIYKTTNGGSSWTDLTNSMVISQLYRLGVGQVSSTEVITGLQDNGTKIYSAGAWMDKIGGDGMECIVDYTNNNTQYGTLYYGDIYRTTNHWGSNTQITPPDPTNPPSYLKKGAWVTPYALDPNSNTTLIAGYSDVYKTTNQGNNWTTISTNLTGGTDLRSVAIAPSNSNYIYVATLGNIWRTTVGGGTGSWVNITSPLPVGTDNITYISVKNNDPNTVWVSFGGYNSNGVYQTINGGTNWTNISAGLPSLPVMCVIQNTQNTGQDELYAATDVGVYVKVGNANWVPFSTGLPNVVVTELEIYYDANPTNSKIRAATFGRGLWESDLYSQAVLAPDADFIADNTTPTTQQTVSFTDMSTNSPTSWSWSFAPSTVTYMGGTNASSQNPQLQFDAPGNYTVALTATNAGGSDTETKVNYIVVTYPAPIADFSADNLSPTTNDTVSFTDLSTNFPDTWLWTFTPSTITFTDGTDQNSQNPKVRFDEPGTYSVDLLASNGGGADNELKTDYIVVTYPAPVVDFSADNLSPTTIDQVIFTDLSTYFPYAWTWSFSPSTITFVDGTNQNSQNPKVLFDQVGLYSVELTATNDGGNGTLTKIDYINVREALSVTVSATPDEICFGGSAQLVATPEGGTGTYAYIWTSNPSGFNSMEQNPVVSPLVTTVYTVEVSDGEHSVNADVEILVDQLPVITLGDWPELLCNQEEPPVQLTAIPEGGIYSGDNVTNNGLFSPEEASIGWHVITYSYEDENRCESSKQDSIYVDNCVGIHSNLINEVSVMIFPNPNKGTFAIKSDYLIQKVEIVNMLGEMQFTKSFSENEINLHTQLVEGVYIIHIFVIIKRGDSQILKKKIVVN